MGRSLVKIVPQSFGQNLQQFICISPEWWECTLTDSVASLPVSPLILLILIAANGLGCFYTALATCFYAALPICFPHTVWRTALVL